MSILLAGLASAKLEMIADILERGPGGAEGVAHLQSRGIEDDVLTELRIHLSEADSSSVARMLRAVAAERHAAVQTSDRRLELVWTGPERDATATRDTAVVVRELFQSAERDVLVAGYALFNARPIFEPLADRMLARPALRVRLFLNIARGDDMRSDDEITADFTRRLRTQHLPAGRLPEVYFDPRSLDRRAEHRAVMHAKCVQVDDSRSFVTSANLTEAAQVRNIELGVVINDPAWCKAVRQQFDDLVTRGELRRLV